MPTVLRVQGFRFYFYAHEGQEPPHVHVDKGTGTLKIWLTDLELAGSEGLKPPEIREAWRLAHEHRTKLLKAWHEFQRRKG